MVSSNLLLNFGSKVSASTSSTSSPDWMLHFSIVFFDRPSFDVPKLARFIGRTEGLRLPRKAAIELTLSDIGIVQQFQESPCQLRFGLRILGCALGRRVYSLSNICRHLLPFLPSVEQLDFKGFYYFSSSASRPQEQMVDSTQWLELFRSFPGSEDARGEWSRTKNCFRSGECGYRGSGQRYIPRTLRPSLQWDSRICVCIHRIVRCYSSALGLTSALRAPHPQRRLA